MVIQYGYKYEKEYGVYNVRRLDDECLDYHIPYGLLLSLYYGSGINFKGEKVANLNDFVNYFASLNFDLAFKELQNLYSEGIFPVMVIRTLINYFLKLQLYKFQLQNGLTFAELLSKEKIFWKQQPILAQHLKKLTAKNIDNILYVLLNEECKMKGKSSLWN